MNQALFGIENLDVYLVGGILVFFGLIEVLAGHLNSTKRTFSDWIQELGSFIALSALIKPGIVLAIYFLGTSLLGDQQNLIGHWNFVLLFFFYILIYH